MAKGGGGLNLANENSGHCVFVLEDSGSSSTQWAGGSGMEVAETLRCDLVLAVPKGTVFLETALPI